VIQETQQNTEVLEVLAAARGLARRSRQISGWQILTLVVAPVVITVCTNIVPLYKFVGVFAAATAFLIDCVFLEPRRRFWQRESARVQEAFDCEVLSLDWPAARTGRKPMKTDLADAVSFYRRRDPDLLALAEWYPAITDAVPIAIGRLVCQRCNCWWDADVRRRYAKVLVIGIVCWALGLGVVAISLGSGFRDFLVYIYAPMTPVLAWLIRERQYQNDAAERSERLSRHVEGIVGELKDGSASDTELLLHAIEVQAAIFDRRSRSPYVPDFLYARDQKRYQRLMNAGAEELVAELKQ
jgi:hypothetical protein